MKNPLHSIIAQGTLYSAVPPRLPPVGGHSFEDGNGVGPGLFAGLSEAVFIPFRRALSPAAPVSEAMRGLLFLVNDL